MKFWTIWTLPACTIREKLRRTRDWAAMKIGRKLPLRIRYWVTIQEISRSSAVDPTTNVMGMSITDILEKLDKPRVVC
jgi:hypothetical protein